MTGFGKIFLTNDRKYCEALGSHMRSQTELEGIYRVPQGILHVPSNSNRVPAVYTTSTLFQLSWYTPDCRVYCIYPAPILPFYTPCCRVYCMYPTQDIVIFIMLYCILQCMLNVPYSDSVIFITVLHAAGYTVFTLSRLCHFYHGILQAAG